MPIDFLTSLVPSLSARPEDSFNVFDVMRHGTHEKQLSNVFAWLLDPTETHRLGQAFQEIFLAAVSSGMPVAAPVAPGAFSVRQEVNTSVTVDAMDIADIVLENHDTCVVVENYFTSDGHGHNFAGYRDFGAREGKRSVVVMLCETMNRSALTDGWEGAPVVTYSDLLSDLRQYVLKDLKYRNANPDVCTFIEHMHRRFVGGRTVENEILVDFIDAMCRTGEAQHFGVLKHADAATRFADKMHEAALERFGDSRDMLSKVKQTLVAYGRNVLAGQVNDARVGTTIEKVSGRYSGIYQWTINFDGTTAWGESGQRFQIKFGPSAWKANEGDEGWTQTVGRAEADYTRLFITCGREVRMSAVTLSDVLDGSIADSRQLAEDVLAMLSDHADERGVTSPDAGVVSSS